eukprot:scaffold110720_cov61-Attheya_sp.AAC.2
MATRQGNEQTSIERRRKKKRERNREGRPSGETEKRTERKTNKLTIRRDGTNETTLDTCFRHTWATPGPWCVGPTDPHCT